MRIFLTILLFLVMLGGIMLLEVSLEPPKPENFDNIALIINEQNLLVEEKNEKLLQDFLVELNEIIFRQKNRVNSTNIPNTVNEISSISMCAKLCYSLAKDKLFEEQNSGAIISSLLQKSLIEPCLEDTLEINNLVGNLALELEINDIEFRTNLAQAIGKLQIPEAKNKNFDTLLDGVGNSTELMNEIITTNISMSIGVALELIFVKTTIQIFKQIFAKVIAKTTVTATASATSAVIDGPLPIGDAIGAIICIGGLSWSGYDFYQARVALPAELKKVLQNSMSDYYNNLKFEAINQINELLKADKAQRDLLTSQLQKQLTNEAK